MARHQGVFKVARTLRLEYSKLKERAGVKPRRRRPPDALPFVEMRMPGPMAAAESVIELTNCRGARMTLRLPSPCGQDLVALAEVFLRPRP